MNTHHKKILVTGGAGFIGSHLVDALINKGADVSVIDNLSTGSVENINNKCKFYKLDISDQKVDKVFKEGRFDFVYSLAFNTNVPRAVKDPLFDVQSLVGNLNIMEMSKKYNVKKIILASSGFVYGNTKRLPTLENEEIMPDNPYIITKFASENYLKFYNKAYGMDFVVLRYSTVYGPRQINGAMADYINSIMMGKQAIIYGNGLKTRDYVFIDDVISANLKVLDFKSDTMTNPIFNIGTSKETTLNELYFKIAKFLNKKSNPLYVDDRPGEIMRFKLSYGKAKKYLNWEPKFDLDKGLILTIESKKSA